MPNLNEKFPENNAEPLSFNDLNEVSGGQNNAEHYYDNDYFNKWYDWVTQKHWNSRCPHCGNYYGKSMDKYTNNQWWYCYYHNKLHCFGCGKECDELY